MGNFGYNFSSCLTKCRSASGIACKQRQNSLRERAREKGQERERVCHRVRKRNVLGMLALRRPYPCAGEPRSTACSSRLPEVVGDAAVDS
eukprot:1605234-Pleurochrysis_carterae.AAC.2